MTARFSQYFCKHITTSPRYRTLFCFGIAGLGATASYVFASPMFYPLAQGHQTYVQDHAYDFHTSIKDVYYAYILESTKPEADETWFRKFASKIDVLSLLRTPEPKVELFKPKDKYHPLVKTSAEEFDLDKDTVFIHLRGLQFPENSIREVMQEQAEKQVNYNISQLLTELLTRHPGHAVFVGADKYEICGHSTSITCNDSFEAESWSVRPDIDAKGNEVYMTGYGTKVSEIRIATELNTTAYLDAPELILKDKRKQWATVMIFGVSTYVASSLLLRRSPVFTSSVPRMRIPSLLVTGSLITPILASFIAAPFFTAHNLYFGVYTPSSRTVETFVDTNNSMAKRISNYVGSALPSENRANSIRIARTKETKYEGYKELAATSKTANVSNALFATGMTIMLSPFITIPITICYSAVAGIVIMVLS